MTEKRTISKDDCETLSMWDSPEDGAFCGEWSFLAKSPIDTSRWQEWFWLVLQHADGTIWGIEYANGLTENQDGTYPWDKGYVRVDDKWVKEEGGTVDLVPLEPYDVTTTHYQPVKP